MDIRLHVLEKITNNFSPDFKIGSGGYGDVYKGVLCDEQLIAVKLLHDTVEGLDDKLFKNEVGNLLTVDHPNIVRFLGYCYETQSKYIQYNGENVFGKHICKVLCFEYLKGGSLEKHLHEQTFAPDWSTRYNIIKGICEGLNYLHGCKPRIFHLDLKPGNILLDSSMMPKLADFGLSKLFSESHTKVTHIKRGTDKYMPPEYRNGGNISEKNDVFSLGVVMIDIMEGPEGYSLFRENGESFFKQKVLSKWSSMIEPTSEYRSGQLHQLEMCINTAMRCVYPERGNRPTIDDILATLNTIETGIPSTKSAVVPPCLIIDLKTSLDKTVNMLTAELDNMRNSMANMERVPDIREASSGVEESLIIGRNKEKQEILSILSKGGTNEMVILPIYGIGGIGKTTLAKLIFDDRQFSGYSRVWVELSKTLDLTKIGNSIISLLTDKVSNIDNIPMLKIRLAALLDRRSILIVLDDLWENDAHKLDELKDMLRLGQGSKIILVTTRDESIARNICNTVKNGPYRLEILTDDMCWNIIKQKSCFEDRHAKTHSEQIGRDIAIKCGGVALAAQSLGYMLRDMTSDQWESVSNSDIWNLSTTEDSSLRIHEVLASLRLSYNHMHQWLQDCFSYCAIFPKGHEIRKHDLIHQWIALEFTEPSRIFDSMQLCEQYITHLLGLSFLQYPTAPSDCLTRRSSDTYFTMHDLVHDLAREMLADKVNKNDSIAGSSCQYALLTDPSIPLQSSLNSPENLKALHFLDYRNIKFSEGAISPAKCLHVLDLRGWVNLELPDSIGQLKQLRYLYVQCSMIPDCITKLSKLNYLSLEHSTFKALPESIGDIKGLMHLDLLNCRSLRELPVSFAELKQLVHLNLSHCHLEQDNMFPQVIGKLPKLRYLMISSCSVSDIQNLLVTVSTLHNLEHLDMSWINELVHIPESFGNLKKLHTLDLSGCTGIHELPSWMNKMVSLKIVDMTKYVLKISKLECSRNLVLFEAIYPLDLEISELENVMSLEEAQSIELLVKQSVRYLTLEWTVDCDTKHVDDKDVLEKLVARKNVAELHVTGYRSLSFPTNWQMGIEQYLPNVRKITLKNLPKCNNLSPLGQLPNLSSLELHRMDSLEELNTADSCGELIFPELCSLYISFCPKLRIKPCLPRAVRSISIEASDNMLISLAESVRQTSASPISLLSELDVGKCTVPLHQWEFLQHVSALRELTIKDCSNLAIFSSPEVIQRLSSFESLVLKDSVLAELPTWLGQLTFLQHLTIRLPKLQKLNDNIRQLTRLQSLHLNMCRSMTSLPQWIGELTSLNSLCIRWCGGITYLPTSMRQLSNIIVENFVLRDDDIRTMVYWENMMMHNHRAGVRHSWTRWPQQLIPGASSSGSRIDNSGTSADAAAVRDANAVALVHSFFALSIESGSAAKYVSVKLFGVGSHSTQNMVRKSRVGVRHTRTRRPRPLVPGASSSGPKIKNSATDALIATDEVHGKALVSSFSAFSIDSATKRVSDKPVDVINRSTQENVAHKHDAGVGHTWTHEIRQPRQLLPAASAATTNSPDTSSGSRINNSAADALIPTDVVATAAATDMDDLICSFSALSLDPGSATDSS